MPVFGFGRLVGFSLVEALSVFLLAVVRFFGLAFLAVLAEVAVVLRGDLRRAGFLADLSRRACAKQLGQAARKLETLDQQVDQLFLHARLSKQIAQVQARCSLFWLSFLL